LGSIYQIFYELCCERKLFNFKGTFTNGFTNWYSSLSFYGFDRAYIAKYGNPYGRFKPQGGPRILKRLIPFKTLLRLRSDLLTFDELRNFLVTSIGSVTKQKFEIQIGNRHKDMMSVLNKSIIDLLKVLTDKASVKADKIIKSSFRDDELKSFFLDVDPILTGLDNIKSRLLKALNINLNFPVINIGETLDVILSYDNDLFSNREGSSKAKRRNEFNRFARLLVNELSKAPDDYGKVPKIEFDNDFMFGMKMQAGTMFEKKSDDFLFG
jgi:hypothetical protein